MATAVVEQRVDRLLQHAFFVTNNDTRSVQLDQLLETIITVNHPAIEIVQIAGCEITVFERHQRTQIRRNDRHGGHDHPLRIVAGILELFSQFQTLDDLFDLLLGARRREFFAQFADHTIGIEMADQFLRRFSAHHGFEVVAVFLLRFTILFFREHFHVLKRSGARISNDVFLEVDDLLQV